MAEKKVDINAFWGDVVLEERKKNDNNKQKLDVALPKKNMSQEENVLESPQKLNEKKFQFDIEQAVIYSEILNRKY